MPDELLPGKLVLGKHGDGKLHPLASLTNSGPQKQRAQMLLNGARADVELPRDLFVAAALHQQVQHLLIARRHFHLIQVDHDVVASTSPWESPALSLMHLFRHSFVPPSRPT